MKKGKILSGLLAVAMVANIALTDIGPSYAAGEKVNLAKNCTVTASDAESVNPAANAVDGNVGTHWATNKDQTSGSWIEITLKQPTMVNEVKVLWERLHNSNVQPSDQNIKKWKVEALTAAGYETIGSNTDADYETQDAVVTVAEPKLATKVKVTIDEADANYWANVGISEVEVYGEAQDIEVADNQNHMQTSTVTASTEETGDLTAAKVKDGKFENLDRWASQEHTYQDQWLKTVFPKVTKVKEIDFSLFGRNVNPSPSNIKAFDLEYKDQNEQTQTVHITNTQANGQTGYQTKLRHVFDEPVYMKEFTVKNFDVAISIQGNQGYNNISIVEIEVYSNDQTQTQTLDEVVASITGQTVASDVNELELPKVPNGFTIESNGADFEQIIGKAKENQKLPVVHPLEDKTVKISFNVTETKSGKMKNTGDLDFVVKGSKTQAGGKNGKPVVIPEIQEWYSESNANLSAASITKVVYSDAALEAIVDEFIADYKDFSGKELKKEQGEPKQDAFNFVKEAPDQLLGKEGYTMNIQDDRIIVKSESVTGNMYGMQTILQMYKKNDGSFAIGQMRDYPRFQVRGLLLDVARKPISLEMMKEITRTMRYYKMNDFQAHLSDNYIFLENYGKYENEMEAFKAYEAFRLESSLTNDEGESPTAKDYSISKEDFRNFIQDERALGMNIVPEIDVPAHATSFMKIWPELMVKNSVSSLNANRPLVDHFDLRQTEAVDKIKEIFDDYTTGANPTFDEDTVVHIGADEFLADYKSYRDFVNELVPHVKKTNTVRMWGGLTWIKDNPITPINKNAIENVEMNLWSSDWADGIEMYDMGYKLINTIDDFGYMVPNGSYVRKNSYGDLLNVSRVFSDFEANKLKTKKNGYQYVPAGDDQMLGAAFAIWSDNIDKDSSGLTESDLYWRFFDAMPFYAEKTWAATGTEKGSADNLAALAEELGTGPNTNPYYKEDKTGDNYESYDFQDGLKDTSKNNRDLADGKNAAVKDGALQLNDKTSYVTSPIKQLGNGNELSFDITVTEPYKAGDILFETTAPYGTHDIRIMDDGRLGFTRELHDYYFDYKLPIGQKVNIKIVVSQQKTELFVDGVSAGTATGRFFHNNIEKKTGITNATLALPLERIGSKTNSIAAEIDNIVVTSSKAAEDTYNKSAWTETHESETIKDDKSGKLIYAFDNNSETIWHSNWTTATDKVPTNKGQAGSGNGADGDIWAEINFNQTYKINQFSFTPRLDSNPSGFVTKASLYVKNTADGEWKEVAKEQVFDANVSKKTFYFEEQDVCAVKFVALESNDGWVAVSEFDISNVPVSGLTLTVEAKNGTVSPEIKDSYRKGESVTLTAKPKSGYTFAGWYDSVSGVKLAETAEYTFIMNYNTALEAKFVKEDTPTPENKVTAVGKLSDVTVKEGTSFNELKLPENVEITYGDDQKTNVPVTWEQGEYKSQEGTYTLYGTLTLPENIVNSDDLKASVNVIVTKDSEETDKTANDVLSDIVENQKVPGRIDKGVSKLELPEVPEGFTIKITDVDPEGIIGLDGTVTMPEKDTTVKVTLTVTDPKGNTASHEFEIVVTGKNSETPKVDKTRLEELYKKCIDSYKEANHSKATWKAYQEALAKADAILKKEGATQTEVDAAYYQLEEITRKLNEELKDNPKDNPTDNKKEPVRTGDASSAAGWMILLTAAGAVLLIRRKYAK